MLPDEPKLVHHRSHDPFRQPHQQHQQHRQLLVMDHRSRSETTREAAAWSSRAEEIGVVSSSFDRHPRHPPTSGSSTPEDYVYHLSPVQGEPAVGYHQTPLRVEPPAGYVVPPSSHTVVSGGSERRSYSSGGAGSADSGGSAFIGHDFTAAYGGSGNDEYEKDAPSPASRRRDELDYIARWKSDDSSRYSSSAMSRSYSYSASSSAGAVRYGPGAGGGPSSFSGGSVSRVQRW